MNQSRDHVSPSPVIQTTNLKSWRRLFCFSLRTLFIVITLVAIALLVQINKAKKQKLAVESIRNNSGVVLYSYEPTFFFEEIREGSYGWEPIWLRELLGEDFFYNVQAVELTGSNPNAFSSVSAVTSIRFLILIDFNVGDLSSLSDLNNLELLVIDGTHVHDLSSISSLSNLKHLYVSRTPIKSLSPLYKIKSLESVHLLNSQVPESEIALLKKSLPKCKVEYSRKIQ